MLKNITKILLTSVATTLVCVGATTSHGMWKNVTCNDAYLLLQKCFFGKKIDIDKKTANKLGCIVKKNEEGKYEVDDESTCTILFNAISGVDYDGSNNHPITSSYKLFSPKQKKYYFNKMSTDEVFLCHYIATNLPKKKITLAELPSFCTNETIAALKNNGYIDENNYFCPKMTEYFKLHYGDTDLLELSKKDSIQEQVVNFIKTRNRTTHNHAE